MDSNPIIQFLLNVITLNHSYRWNLVWYYLFNTYILQGIIITVVMAVVAQLLGSLIGLLLYFLRRAHLAPLRVLANLYIWFFRGTPLLVQILFFYTILPYLGLSSPLDQSRLFFKLGFSIQVLPSAFFPALLALALNEGAYMAEIVRAGIDAIDAGQIEAGKSLGMTYGLAMRRIVLPQALRVIVPPLGNEFNSMLKNTSLASVVGVTELLEAAEGQAPTFFAPLELLTVASIYFLLLTTLWTLLQIQFERRLNASNIEPGTGKKLEWWRRLFGMRPETSASPELALPVGIDRR